MSELCAVCLQLYLIQFIELYNNVVQRTKLIVLVFQQVIVPVKINGRGRELGVPQYLLQADQRASVFQKACCIKMSHRVGGETVARYTRLAFQPRENRP